MGTLFGLFRYIKGHIGKAVAAFLLMAGGTAATLVQPRLLEEAVDRGIGSGSPSLVVVSALGIFGFALVSGVLQFGSSFLLIRAGHGMAYGLRNALFAKILSLSFGNFDKRRTGEIIVRVNSDVNTVRTFVRMGLLMMAQSVLMLGGALVLMYSTNAYLARIMTIVLPGTLVLFLVFATIIRPLILKLREKLDRVNNVLQENLAGAKLVRAFAGQARENARFDDANTDHYRLSLKVGYLIASLFPLLFLLGQLGVVISTWFGGTEILEGLRTTGVARASGLSLGELLAFANYAIIALWPIIALGMVLQFISVASASAVRIQEVLDEKPELAEDKDATAVDRVEGRVVFENVTFSYGSGEPAIHDINLEIEPGTMVGIVGPTGCGKSTLVSLIPRYYDAGSGTVSIDGKDVRAFASSALRRRVCLVLQETILMSGSILDNVSFAVRGSSGGGGSSTGTGGAASTDAGGAGTQPNRELIEAAEIACAREFIEDKSGGWGHVIGERGVGLSGGQRQRLAVARAVAADPDLIILDDTTSAVDAATERRLVANLRDALVGKTVIVVSQRINSVLGADRILVMDSGAIVADGAHAELLEKSELYRQIFETQRGELQT